MSLHDKIEAISAGMWNCDMTGSPVDEYVAKWKVLQVVEEYQTDAYAEGRKDEREELIRVLGWAYSKLQPFTFSKQEDALMLDEINLILQGAA